jgi:hypothetical protein
MIGLGDQSLGLVGHELKHAYQYENNEISFRADGQGFGSLYDVSDETSAYNRERLLATGVMFFTDSSIKWNNSNVKTFGQTMNPPAYIGLPEGPININSETGVRMRANTFFYGFSGKAFNQEIYKGWQTDYSRGINSRLR